MISWFVARKIGGDPADGADEILHTDTTTELPAMEMGESTLEVEGAVVWPLLPGAGLGAINLVRETGLQNQTGDRRGPAAQAAYFAIGGRERPEAELTVTLAKAVRQAFLALRTTFAETGRDSPGSVPDVGCLPIDESGDGRLDRVAIVAERGFGEVELRALDRLVALQWHPRRSGLRLMLLGFALLGDDGPGPIRRARRWVSATPFLPSTRRNGSGSAVRGDLERVRRRRRWPFAAAQVQVEPLKDSAGRFQVEPRRWAGPRDTRGPIPLEAFKGVGERAGAAAFEITFPEPVAGPLWAGRGTALGLGLFLPALARPGRK